VTFGTFSLPSIWHFQFMFMPIGGAPIETFWTPTLQLCGSTCLRKLLPSDLLAKDDFFAHSVTFGDIISKNDEIHIFCSSVTFCCYGSKKPLATTLVFYNTITKVF